jgi:hypothetical protein
MILRRVIDHFRKQEWTAIGLDFLIVVLGVLMGIQVSNWNQLRADRMRVDIYLQRLKADFEQIENRLDGDIAEFDAALASIEFLRSEIAIRPALT